MKRSSSGTPKIWRKTTQKDLQPLYACRIGVLMLITFQFPLADCRELIPKAFKLAKPLWPAASSHGDFIRALGPIKMRRRGGLPGWIGENLVCEGWNGIKFKGGMPDRKFHTQRGGIINARIAFRRFYSDGNVLSKVEIGFSVSHQRKRELILSRNDLRNILRKIMDCPLVFSEQYDDDGKRREETEVKLISAGPNIAKKILVNTTEQYNLRKASIQNWWIKAGTPVVYIDSSHFETLAIPYRMERVVFPGGGVISFGDALTSAGREIPLWVTERFRRGRAIRIILMRMHAERNCFRLILELLSKKVINPVPFSEDSEKLQKYLQSTLQKLKGLYRKLNGDTDIEMIAMDAIQKLTGMEVLSLQQALHNINIRPNLYKNIQAEINNRNFTLMNISHSNNIVVGDENISDQNYQAITAQNLSQLAQELKQLWQAMSSQVSTPEQSIAVAEIAKAQNAAQDGDTSKIASFLKNAGSWALEVAEKIGVSIAIESLKKAI